MSSLLGKPRRSWKFMETSFPDADRRAGGSLSGYDNHILRQDWPMDIGYTHKN